MRARDSKIKSNWNLNFNLIINTSKNCEEEVCLLDFQEFILSYSSSSSSSRSSSSTLSFSLRNYVLIMMVMMKSSFFSLRLIQLVTLLLLPSMSLLTTAKLPQVKGKTFQKWLNLDEIPVTANYSNNNPVRRAHHTGHDGKPPVNKGQYEFRVDDKFIEDNELYLLDKDGKKKEGNPTVGYITIYIEYDKDPKHNISEPKYKDWKNIKTEWTLVLQDETCLESASFPRQYKEIQIRKEVVDKSNGETGSYEKFSSAFDNWLRREDTKGKKLFLKLGSDSKSDSDGDNDTSSTCTPAYEYDSELDGDTESDSKTKSKKKSSSSGGEKTRAKSNNSDTINFLQKKKEGQVQQVGNSDSGKSNVSTWLIGGFVIIIVIAGAVIVVSRSRKSSGSKSQKKDETI